MGTDSGSRTPKETYQQPSPLLPIMPKLNPRILLLEGFYTGLVNAPDTAEENPEKTQDGGGGEKEELMYE